MVRIITEDRQADNGGKNTWGSLRNGRMLTYSVYTTGLLIFPPNILLYSNLSNRENRDAHYNLREQRCTLQLEFKDTFSYLLLLTTWVRH